MDITSAYKERHSVEEFVSKLTIYADSGVGVLHVRSSEPIRALGVIRRQVLSDGAEYHEWDVVNGNRDFVLQDVNRHAKEGDGNIDLSEAFSRPLGALRDAEVSITRPAMTYYVFVNPHVFMEGNPHIAQLLTMYCNLLPSTNICVILLTPDVPLPADYSGATLAIDFDTPGIGELRESLDDVLAGVEDQFSNSTEMTDDDRDRICYVGAGLTKSHFETYVALSLVKAGREGKTSIDADDIIKEVSVGKTDVVNANDILELYPSGDINHVGGMENLKDWIRKRARCYSDEAKEFGVEAPKGMVFTGPPGTGKSLAAKAIAGVLGIPLVRLDFGRVFNSLVGASEQRMRTALRMVESMSPCVLFADEIDKGLGGIGGSSDGGTSNRVLGSFLTWLQDCKYPVFTMVTANNIDGLPPELLRRGRFDAVFSTSLPNDSERREVLRIHLKLRGRDIDDFEEDDIQKVIAASNRYVPAEIESAVKDALVDAFDAGEELTMNHVVNALSIMVPLSKSFEAQIRKMEEWAKTNATPASLTPTQKAERVAESKNRSRVSGRIRRS